MRTFKTEDFSGAGQYLVRLCPKQKLQIERGEKPHLCSTYFLSTIMYKVGYIVNNYNIGGTNNQIYTLTAMSDGLTRIGHFEGTKDDSGKSTPSDQWIKILWSDTGDGIKGRRKLVDRLNHGESEYRFATQEEVVRVVMYQSSRWRNS
ncbi:MAG TPA: hypothetical protein PK243_11125 [Flexilinea sp.]|nr:hypothetical protein [Flexilinea sp.]